MRRVQRTLVIVAAFLAGVAPVLALSEPSIEEREQNRRLLEKWRNDPDHMARLQRDLAVFRALPAERRDRLRQLDRDLYREDSATRARLLAALDRYQLWLSRLDETDRTAILAAPTIKERLHLIHQLRGREWQAQLPKADRERLQAIQDKDKRLVLVQQLRQQEQERHADWRVAKRFWKELSDQAPLPCKPQDFPKEVGSYVTSSLLPSLGAKERERLTAAEGRWPSYPRILVELADKHPLLPGPMGPTKTPEKARLKTLNLTKPQLEHLKAAQGKWPEFGFAVMKHCSVRQRNVLLPSTCIPSHAGDFGPAIEQFINQELQPVLDREDSERLHAAEGQWPLYPQLLLELARRYDLQVPQTGLPGRREDWNKYRP